MAYIGAEPVPGQNREVDDISSGFNGNATAFTLQVSSVNVSPESANNILINLGGVLQNPGTDYTIAASTITFTTAPAAGLSFFGLILGAGINTATVADDTIGASKLIDTAVTAGSYTTADITVDAQGRITAAANGTIAQAEIANDAVGADQLASNAVVNDSVASNAAIAGTKISPDFGSQNIVTTGSITGNDLEIDSGTLSVDATNNRVGIGTTSPAHKLHVADATTPELIVEDTTNNVKAVVGADNSVARIGSDTNHPLTLRTNDTERVHIDTSGNVGIGTSSPPNILSTEQSTGNINLDLHATGSGRGAQVKFHNDHGTSFVGIAGSTDGALLVYQESNAPTLFHTNNTERMRIDSSGKVAIATATTTEKLMVAGAIDFTGAATGNTANSGKLTFESATAFFNSKGPNTSTRGKIGLNIAASDGSLGYNALKVQTGGQVTFANSDDTDPWNNTGANPATVINATNVRPGLMASAAHNGDVMALNRMGSDGAIVIFYAQGNPEGSIDVSGSTVSLNGAHLSRWTKILSISDTDKSKRPTIYRGSVLTNLDEMCEWKRVEYTNSDNITKIKPYSGSEDVGSTVEYTDDKGDKYSAKVVLETNEQLNKMEVSSVEGDPNVAGVFQGWDDDDDTIVNDLHCAMTGDFVIRIAKGVTVQRGDLLMSAGDGTAKPQGDDIVRSKTVAKVTSTTVSTTYDDESFCVPCVLMAC